MRPKTQEEPEIRHEVCGRGRAGGRSRLAGGVTQAVNITAVSVADQLDEQAGHVSKSASLMHEAASYLRRAGPVIRAARSCVRNSAWAGVSDEDVALEQALRDGGWL